METPDDGPADQRVALITGANKGIGFEIARQLAQLGHIALIGARDEHRSREAADQLVVQGYAAVFMPLDVTDPQSIALAAQSIRQAFGRLDVLVNNAAIAIDDAPPSQLEIEVLRRRYETNMFGVVAVTQALLPLLRQSPCARIVYMSSGRAY